LEAGDLRLAPGDARATAGAGGGAAHGGWGVLIDNGEYAILCLHMGN
jgi:hypothetical protein